MRLGLIAAGAADAIQKGLDREETRQARLSRDLNAKLARDAQFKMYSQKREDQINDELQDIIGVYRGMDLSNPQIAGLIPGGKTQMEEVKKYYDIAQRNGANFSALLTTAYGDTLTPESFTQQNFTEATRGFIDARLSGKTDYKSPITVGYSPQLKDMFKAEQGPVDPDQAVMVNFNRSQIILARIGTDDELPDDKETLKKIEKANKDIIKLKLQLEGETLTGTGGTGGDFEAKDRNSIRSTVTSVKQDAFSEFATTDVNGMITSSLDGTFDKAMSTFEGLIKRENGYLNTLNPMTGNVPLNNYTVNFYNEYARNLGQKIHGDYKIRLKNRLENTAVKKTYNNPQEVEQGIASGQIKRGDVVQVGTIKSVYTGKPANDPNAFMDMEIINQRQMPKLLRVKQGSDGTMYEYYSPSY
jgi:hypothetical protein